MCVQGESVKVCVCTRGECEGVCVQGECEGVCVCVGESVKVCVCKGRG